MNGNYIELNCKQMVKPNELFNDDTTQLAMNVSDDNLFPTYPTQKNKRLWY